MKPGKREEAKQQAELEQERPLFKVRTVTSFITLQKDKKTWKQKLLSASNRNAELAKRFAGLGYETQTSRLVTNPFGEYLRVDSTEAALEDMKFLQSLLGDPAFPSGMRVRVAIGEARNAEEIKLVPALIRGFGDLSNICVNVGYDDETGTVDGTLIRAAAEAVVELSKTTKNGEGNFNFTVNFNCGADIPFFPAGYNQGGMPERMVLGFEYTNLLVMLLNRLKPASRGKGLVFPWKEAFTLLRERLESHMLPLSRVTEAFAADNGVLFAGVDTSSAPSKAIDSVVQVYKAVGVAFGEAGTVEASSFLTKVFKSLRIEAPVVGFSGNMMACLEDRGLARLAEQSYDIRALLTYSAVCGIGLDTVPIPGDTDAAAIAGLMRDTGTMAFRLKKPLTCRLFPAPGLAALETTKFDSDDLCNCTVFKVPWVI